MTADERLEWRKKNPMLKRFEELSENSEEARKVCTERLVKKREEFKKNNPNIVVVSESFGGYLWSDDLWVNVVDISFYVKVQ